jgi:hypothetical protein
LSALAAGMVGGPLACKRRDGPANYLARITGENDGAAATVRHTTLRQAIIDKIFVIAIPP